MKLPGVGYQIDTYQSLPNEIVITICNLPDVLEPV